MGFAANDEARDFVFAQLDRWQKRVRRSNGGVRVLGEFRHDSRAGSQPSRLLQELTAGGGRSNALGRSKKIVWLHGSRGCAARCTNSKRKKPERGRIESLRAACVLSLCPNNLNGRLRGCRSRALYERCWRWFASCRTDFLRPVLTRTQKTSLRAIPSVQCA